LFENPIAKFRTNVRLDRNSKDSKKINPVPKNPTESYERQPADQKGLKPRLTVVETGSYSSVHAALAKNDVNSSDDVEGIQLGLIARKQQSGMMVPEWDIENAYIELITRKDNRQVTIKFMKNQSKIISHRENIKLET